MSATKIDFRNPVIWLITAVSAVSPFVLSIFLPVNNNVAFAVIFPLIVIPFVWISLWKLYMNSLKRE